MNELENIKSSYNYASKVKPINVKRSFSNKKISNVKIFNEIKFLKKAIIIGGSKGIGKSISTNLKKAGFAVMSCSRKEVDTAKLHSVDTFIKKNKSADLIVLNSGGPPPKKVQANYR